MLVKWQHSDRGLVRHRWRRRLRRGRRPLRRGDAKHLHRLGDVLELALAQILEQDLGRAVDEIAHRARDVDRAPLGDVLEPRRHVHAVAVDVAVLDHDVAEIDADAEFDALPLGDVGVARRHAVLHVDRTAHRFDRTCELGEDAVARRLDEAALMLSDLRLNQLAAVRGEPPERALQAKGVKRQASQSLASARQPSRSLASAHASVITNHHRKTRIRHGHTHQVII
jgi:hypothetical protein